MNDEKAATVEQEEGLEAPAESVDEVSPEQAEIERLTSEMAQYRDEALRARAEADNVRKRAERDVEAAHKYGQERLVNELLPVKDSLDLGLAAAATASDIESLREGMTLTAKMFGDFLDKLAVTAIDPAGERFDPELHQAMTMEASNEATPGTVLRVMQKGYLLNDRLLRPALVVVAKSADA
ncbi:MAG: nucleotide exchange factor GrpE [Gammaproteobacteria bacterium]